MKDSSQDSTTRHFSSAEQTSSASDSSFKELNAGIARIADELERMRKLLETGRGLDLQPARAPQAEQPAQISPSDEQELIALDIDSFLKRYR